MITLKNSIVVKKMSLVGGLMHAQRRISMDIITILALLIAKLDANPHGKEFKSVWKYRLYHIFLGDLRSTMTVFFGIHGHMTNGSP